MILKIKTKSRTQGRGLSILLGLSLLLCVACQAEGSVPVQILAAKDGSLRNSFQAELALTPQEQTQGLMYRKELGKNKGMLFVFSEVVQNPFWMKNTLIPLDILFIDSQKKILNIVSMAVPQTTTPREPAGPYQYVLEIEGGRAQSLGIQPGDKVVFQLP
jgi:uncharacterized protein